METVTKKIFRIVISEVSKTEKEETETKYIKDGEIIDWSKWYKLTDEEKLEYTSVQQPTGEIERGEIEEKIYKQDLEELDVRDLAIYLNRVR